MSAHQCQPCRLYIRIAGGTNNTWSWVCLDENFPTGHSATPNTCEWYVYAHICTPPTRHADGEARNTPSSSCLGYDCCCTRLVLLLFHRFSKYIIDAAKNRLPVAWRGRRGSPSTVQTHARPSACAAREPEQCDDLQCGVSHYSASLYNCSRYCGRTHN